METRDLTVSTPRRKRMLPPQLTELVPHLRRQLFGLSLLEATFERRGFASTTLEKQTHLEQIGCTFLDGYHAGLEAVSVDELPSRLAAIPRERVGFAYEGAAMALTLLDLLTWKSHRPNSRLRQLLAGPGADHRYMIHVGAGWAYARLRQRLSGPPKGMDPLLGWLALDGYGFHEGYFNPGKYIWDRALPERIGSKGREVFDQGLGRSLWFVQGADVWRVAECIGTFPESRRADLWSGVGLACAYAGGLNIEEMMTLRNLVDTSCLPHLTQGVAFAAKARQTAKNSTPNTLHVSRLFCRMSDEEAACVTDDALEELPPDGNEPAYQVWRRRIRDGLNGKSPVAPRHIPGRI